MVTINDLKDFVKKTDYSELLEQVIARLNIIQNNNKPASQMFNPDINFLKNADIDVHALKSVS